MPGLRIDMQRASQFSYEAGHQIAAHILMMRHTCNGDQMEPP